LLAFGTRQAEAPGIGLRSATAGELLTLKPGTAKRGGSAAQRTISRSDCEPPRLAATSEPSTKRTERRRSSYRRMAET